MDQLISPTSEVSRSRFPSLPWASVMILGTIVILGVFADQIAPFDPLQTDLRMALRPPAVMTDGTWSHFLGTDELGRDILSRVIHGARISLRIAFASLLLGGLIGTSVGLIAGYAGGRLDAVLMRITDLTISYPVILLALLLAVVIGPQESNVIVAVAFVLWTRFARVVRGDVLALKAAGYVSAARVAGASPRHIILRHILPNVANTIIVLASLNTGFVILIEASLSFLGAGVPPLEPAWGSMVAQGRDYAVTAWWISAVPAAAIAATILALNLLGDWLRDRLDPRLRPL